MEIQEEYETNDTKSGPPISGPPYREMKRHLSGIVHNLRNIPSTTTETYLLAVQTRLLVDIADSLDRIAGRLESRP